MREVTDPDLLGGSGRSHDLTIYSIVKFFQLAMENNPNIVDSLFTPATCVLHCTAVGTLVRERRRLFLHKGCWPKFKGYAYAHDDPAGAAAQQHLPDELVGRTFFPRRPKAKAPAVPGPKPPETPAE